MPFPVFDAAGPLTGGKYNIAAIAAKMSSDAIFATQFGQMVIAANGDDPNAIAGLEQWYEPSDQELAEFNICESRRGPLKRCTDSALLLYCSVQSFAPQVLIPPQ